MHAYLDAKQDWLIKIDINGGPQRIPYAWRLTTALRTGDAGERPADQFRTVEISVRFPPNYTSITFQPFLRRRAI
jgi:hypothetical protein